MPHILLCSAVEAAAVDHFHSQLKDCITTSDFTSGRAHHAQYIKVPHQPPPILQMHLPPHRPPGVRRNPLPKRLQPQRPPRRLRPPLPPLRLPLLSLHPPPKPRSQNTLLADFASHSRSADSPHHFHHMCQIGSDIDSFTLSTLVSAITNEDGIHQLHALTVSSSIVSHVSVGNATIGGYSRTGLFALAEQVFHTMATCNGYLWNCMVVVYGQHRRGLRALALFQEMVRRGYEVDIYTPASVLTAFTTVKDLFRGSQFHAQMVKSAFERNAHVGNDLIDLYSKCSAVADAKKVFEEVLESDLVLWNTMISGFSPNDDFSEKTLDCFCMMQRVDFHPDDGSFICVINTCANLSSPCQGQQLHLFLVKTVLSTNRISEINALLVMYS